MWATVRALLSRLRGTFKRRGFGQEFDEEAQEHLAMLTERFICQGMNLDEARFAARRQFGGVSQMKQHLVERGTFPQIGRFIQDARYALRQLRRAPAFTIAAVLTLALGIGANVAVFAVVNAVVLRPLPYAEPDRLVAFQSRDTRAAPHPTGLSYPNFFDFRKYNRVFEHLVCYRDTQFTMTGPAQSVHLDGEIVSWDLFPLLGVEPELGRGFRSEEEMPGTHVVVISHELWQTRFGGDQNILGKSLTINAKPFRVVGIAPPNFRFPVQKPTIQMWTTLAVDAGAGEHPMTTQRGARVLDVIARLKPGVTIERAHAQMDTVARALARQFPDHNKNIAGTYVRPELEKLIGSVREPMFVLLGAVFLVLMIACANIANLLLARGAERGREFAVRAAIGASRWDIIRQLLTESLLLGLLGSLAGILFAFTCVRSMLPFVSESIPRIAQASIDGRVLAFCIALGLLTCVLFSLAPASQIAKTTPATSLKEGSRNIARGHDGMRGALVIGQITLGLVLLSGSGLLIASFLYLERRDPGFKPDHLLTFNITLPQSQYSDAQQITFSDRLLQHLATLPGVRSAAIGMPLPLTGSQMSVSFDIQERPAPQPDWPHSDIAIVTPGYFSTMGIPLLKGRGFTEQDDTKAASVLVVNKTFADTFFPGEDVIGKRVKPGATNGGDPTMREIVGLVGNAKQTALSVEPEPIYYFPYKQLPWGIGTIVLRTSVPPLALESAARAALASLDKQAPMYEIRTMEELSSTAIARPRVQTLLLGSFAAIALLLTAIGLYGVLAYSVMRRTREIGVRVALGASRAMILGMILRHAMLLISTGVLIGILGATAGGRLLKNMLYGVNPDNPILLAIACLVIIVTGMLAAYLPARRAASVDPTQALRSE